MDKYEKLLSAVYFNDAETAIQLMETNDYPNKWLDNIFSMGIPIYFITQCNVRLLADDTWSENVMPIILSLREGCAKLMAYWKTKFNYPVEQELDYTSYTNLFFAASPDETDDEVLLSSVQELLNEGYRQVDIDLYCATERFQYGEVERLLKLGADPEVDIDDFKVINDTYGYTFGDKVIVALANILSNNLSNNDIACRYSGQEFIILFDGVNKEGVMEIFAKVKGEFEAFSEEEKQTKFTFSAGILVDDKTLDFDELLATVDERLIQAKRNGKNQIV